MHYVGSVAGTPFVEPAEPAVRHAGLTRAVLVDASVGAVHTQLDVHRLSADGHVARHCHAYEQAAYVLAGRPSVWLDGSVWRLQPGDFVLMPVGSAHAWANAGADDATWLTISTPQRLLADTPRRDTFALADEPWDAASAQPIDPSLPTSRLVGHYAGTPPQAEALRVADPARGRKPAGMDSALLAYSGISVKMLVDRRLGAELLTMFTVDYEPGGSAQVHDHPFEEAYFFLEGEIQGELEGRPYTLRAGDVVWASVGALHGFFNTGGGRVRWIETQAPQPPDRHAYRWVDQWARLERAAG